VGGKETVMHRSEDQELESCADCGGDVDRGRERAYALGPQAVLCHDCAVRRGALWDDVRERWVRDPDTRDLGRGED
jgi:hypothetical protein